MLPNVNGVLGEGGALNKTASQEEDRNFIDGMAIPEKTIRADQGQEGEQTERLTCCSM